MNRLIRRFSHINWALADQGMVSGANFLTGILLARFLGVEGFGIYTLGWLVLVFIGSIHTPLVMGAMMSIGPAYSEQDAPKYYGAVLVQNLAVSVAGTLLIGVGVYLTGLLVPEWGIQRLLWPLVIATFASMWQEFFRRYFFTRERPALAFMFDAIRYLGQIAALFLLFRFSPEGLDSSRAMWITAATAAIAILACPFVMGKVAWSWHWTRDIAARHYRSSKWPTLSAPLERVSEYAFYFGAGSLVGSAGVGALRAAQNMMGIAQILFLGLINVVQIKAAKHYGRDGLAALSKYLQQVAWMAGVATAVICLIFAITPAFWLRLFFGEEFVEFGELVRWWALAYTVNVFVLPLRSGLRALETTLPIFTSAMFAAIFAVVSASLVIDWLGLEGAAIGILLSKMIIVLVMWRGMRRSFVRFSH